MFALSRPVVSAKTARPAQSSRPARMAVVTAAAPSQQSNAALAAAAAAVLLATSTPAIAASGPQNPLTPPPQNEGGRGIVTRLLDSLPSPFPKVQTGDAYDANRKQAKTVGDTQKPIDIPTEQQTVAPEAFPNPSRDPDERPPVLAAAEGDENQGPNAGQFSGLKARSQELIDKVSPATNK